MARQAHGILHEHSTLEKHGCTIALQVLEACTEAKQNDFRGLMRLRHVSCLKVLIKVLCHFLLGPSAAAAATRPAHDKKTNEKFIPEALAEQNSLPPTPTLTSDSGGK